MRLSMRSEYASIPTRGSRFVGLDSITITSVLGSALLEHEGREAIKAKAAKAERTDEARAISGNPATLRKAG